MTSRNRRTLGRYACLIILAAAAAWPSAGSARTAKRGCDVNDVMKMMLHTWANLLSLSSTTNPEPIVAFYADNAVLVPTCKNGPLNGRTEIKKYFVDFLKAEPQVEFDAASTKIGGTCAYPFASGLYTFTLKGDNGRQLQARYTFIFKGDPRGWSVAQHHSSLEPESTSRCPD